ncbi:hypothetical protein TI04_04470 [Achromatium sp. WMS2]|nr:hypothetical protein TI04_04470 [Achromatium sp. WMS2]
MSRGDKWQLDFPTVLNQNLVKAGLVGMLFMFLYQVMDIVANFTQILDFIGLKPTFTLVQPGSNSNSSRHQYDVNPYSANKEHDQQIQLVMQTIDSYYGPGPVSNKDAYNRCQLFNGCDDYRRKILAGLVVSKLEWRELSNIDDSNATVHIRWCGRQKKGNLECWEGPVVLHFINNTWKIAYTRNLTKITN